jgi:hypothetical protein
MASNSNSNKDIQELVLKLVNECRAKHKDVAPVRLNESMSQIAQNWAEHLANTGQLSNNAKYLNDKEHGENLYFYGTNCSVELTGKEIHIKIFKMNIFFIKFLARDRGC